MNFNEDEFYNFESLEDMMEAGIACRQRGSNLHKVSFEDSATYIGKFLQNNVHRFIRANVTLGNVYRWHYYKVASMYHRLCQFTKYILCVQWTCHKSASDFYYISLNLRSSR